MILDHPQMWLLPVFTYFTIGPRKICCCCCTHDGKVRSELEFSRLLTIFNIVISFVSFLCGLTFMGILRANWLVSSLFLGNGLVYGTVATIPGVIFTLIFCCSCNCKLEFHHIEPMEECGIKKERDSIHVINKKENISMKDVIEKPLLK